MALGKKEQAILEVNTALALKLTEHDYKSSWTLAGQLNELLKNTEDLSFTEEQLAEIKKNLTSYYVANTALQKLNNRFYAIGKSMETVVSALQG